MARAREVDGGTALARDDVLGEQLVPVEVDVREPALGYFASVGDFNYLGDRADLPTVIVGPDGENIHGAGEFVYTDEVVEVAEMLVEAGEELLC